MGGFIQPNPTTEGRETNLRAIGIAIAVVAAIIGVLFLISRTEQKAPTRPHPYVANVKLSSAKRGALWSFVGATVSYGDGTGTSAGKQTVTRVVVEVTFRDSIRQ